MQGTIYFTSRTGAFIGEFDPNTGDVREFRIDGPKLLLHDITFDPNGVAWFTVMKARATAISPRERDWGSEHIFRRD